MPYGELKGLVLNVNTWEGPGSGLFLRELRCGKSLSEMIMPRIAEACHYSPSLLQGTDLKHIHGDLAWDEAKWEAK